MSSKSHCLLACLNVPQGTRKVLGRRKGSERGAEKTLASLPRHHVSLALTASKEGASGATESQKPTPVSFPPQEEPRCLK